MRTFVIDCREIKTEKEFWKQYLLITQPEYMNGFGRNLNAFWDALSGGGPGWPGECTIIIKNADYLKTIGNGSFFEGLHKTSTDLREMYPSNKIRLIFD